MDKTLALSAGRSGVRIPGRGKCSLRTIAVDAKIKYPLYFWIFSRSRENLLRSLRSVFPLCDRMIKFSDTQRTWIVIELAASGSSGAEYLVGRNMDTLKKFAPVFLSILIALNVETRRGLRKQISVWERQYLNSTPNWIKFCKYLFVKLTVALIFWPLLFVKHLEVWWTFVLPLIVLSSISIIYNYWIIIYISAKFPGRVHISRQTERPWSAVCQMFSPGFDWTPGLRWVSFRGSAIRDFGLFQLRRVDECIYGTCGVQYLQQG